MEGFKPVIKMKTGGSVSKAVAAHEKKEMAAEKKGMHTDIVEDKKLVKKAINIHDDQLHEGAKTDLSKLKKGGRCKKDGGTVRKYKCGGEVKKMADGGLTSGPIQNIVNADVLRRRRMGQMGAAPAGGMGAVPPGLAQAAATPGAQPPGPIMKKGGKVKKMADGKSTGFVDVPQTSKSAGPAPMLKDVLAATRSPTGRTATPSEVQAAIKNAPRMTARERAFSGADNLEKSRAVDMPMGEAKPITVAPRGSVGNVGGMSSMQLKKGGKAKRGCK